MSKLVVAYRNSKEPESAPIKSLSDRLIEKWTKRDKEKAKKFIEKYKNQPLPKGA